MMHLAYFFINSYTSVRIILWEKKMSESFWERKNTSIRIILYKITPKN